MIDEEDYLQEKINKRIEKNNSKHFNILINGEKIRVVNSIIKQYKTKERSGKILQLISKFSISIPQRENVEIIIRKNEKIISIIGNWCFEWYGNGKHMIAYWIENYKENKE